jgi:hypothetical protein
MQLAKILATALLILLVVSAGANAGILVAIGDEWMLSDRAFSIRPQQTNQLAENIASYFSGNQPANFLVISSLGPINSGPRGVTGPALAAKMQSLGHSWTIDANAPITAANLSHYDGIFFAGVTGSGSSNAAEIGDYIRGGGHVLVMAGTGIGSAGTEAAAWNPLLNQFGLGFGSQWFALDSNLLNVPVIPSNHPLALGVSAFSWDYGQIAVDLDANDASNTVAIRGDFSQFGNGPQGAINDVIAVYASVPEPASLEICVPVAFLFAFGVFRGRVVRGI